MIVADISELEHIADILSVTSSEIDDTLNKAKITFAEMSADLEFAQYIHAQPCIEKVGVAVSALFNVNERISELKSVVFSALSGYSDNERACKNAVSRMTAYLSLLNDTATAALSLDCPSVTGLEQSINQDEIQKMICGSAEELQMANIAAVSKIIEKEYPVKQIQVMSDGKNQ